METCAWVPLDAAGFVPGEFGDWSATDEEEVPILMELSEALFLSPDTVMGLFLDDSLVMMQHLETGNLVLASMMPDAEIQYLQRICTTSANGNGNGKDKMLWYILGGIGGAGLGYFALRGRGQQMVGAGAGAAAGLLGAYLVAGRKNGTTAGLGRRIPRQVRYAPRGAVGAWPRRVNYAPRGPMAGCRGCGPKVY